ncbi:dna-directed rna, partial [Lynx pardinus]
MSAFRWGRGASGLRRALWPAGPPGPLAEEGALSGVWGRRRSLSASPCEQDRRKDWGHVELLEVLEARVRQLQAARVSEGSFKELVYVFFMVKDAGLTPDLLSYAAALQCMGRLDQDARTVQRCLDQMAQDGLRLQDLFSSVPLCQEEQAALLQAVHKAQPTFSPPLQPQPEPQVNTSPLLREIYAK